MKHAQLRGLDRRRAARLLTDTQCDLAIANRIDILSRRFLGYPYKANPLIGSAERAELFVASLDCFDCVTYIETILALARATDVDDFIEELRRVRYEHGCIRWDQRNHYMTRWIRNNVREGIVKPVLVKDLLTVRRDRLLNVVPGLAQQHVRLKCVPKPALRRLETHLVTGDVIFFASTRRNLDIFHAGIIARDGEKLLMRHASRSRGSVVEQKLDEFIQANQMAGVVVVRPQEVVRRRLSRNGARTPVRRDTSLESRKPARRRGGK